MKKFIVSASILLLALGCVKDPTPVQDPDSEYHDVIDNLISTAVYNVPVQEGYTTFVTYKGQLLAVTSTAMTIQIPKSAVQTKSDGDLTVYYKPGTVDVSTSWLWQTIAFEDSKQGDYDYNDLIIHTKYETSGNSLKVSVHPIAYGATKAIKLGFNWHQGYSEGTVMVSDNCREELFGGKEDFINTTGYDIHYDSFVKDVTVDLPSTSDAVTIDWFIIVDNDVYIYAVNQYGNDCIDDAGMPLGFAITDAGNGAVNLPEGTELSAAAMTKAGEYSAWSDVTALFDFPAEPEASVYEELPSLDDYQSWGTSASADYYLPAGETKEIQFSGADNDIYVSGELTITNKWGNNITIHVLDGGIVNFGYASIQNVTLYCYGGTVNFTGNTNVNTGSKFYFSGDLSVDGTHTIGGNAVFFVGNRMDAGNIKFNGSPYLYVGCCVYAEESVDITNTAKLFIAHYLNTPKLTMSANGGIYLNSDIDGGAMVDVTDLFLSSNTTNRIESVGSSNYAVFNVRNYLLNGYSQGTDRPFDLSDRFIGKVDVHYQAIATGGSWTGNDSNVRIAVSGDVMVNGNTYLPATSCHPSFGESGGEGGETGTGDSGLCWWKFPMEQVDVNTCYDFDSWRTSGDFTFVLKEGARVFDIYDENPAVGEGRVYHLE